jgi:hypothetical protein
MRGTRGAMERILGPTGPDLGCDHSGDMLDQFVEAELAGRRVRDEFPEVANHIDACPDCGEDYVALRALLADAAGPAGELPA